MSPPSVVTRVVGPAVVFVESEIILVRTVFGYECALFVTFLLFVNSLPVKPLVKRTAVVEHTVKNDFNATLVCFFDNLGKKFVARLEVLFVGYTVNISGGKTVFFLTVF